jgi:hyperpolarization activated cyclic nucleotide-gated potassium channel 4
LLEAVKQGHDRVATLLFTKGAKLNLEDAGSRLCMAVSKGDAEFIQGTLAYGADPNSKDYDHRNPLHIAAAEGLYMMAKLLVDAGASVITTDRCDQNNIPSFIYAIKLETIKSIILLLNE